MKENQFGLNTTMDLTKGFRLQWEKSQAGYVLLYPEGMIRLNTSAAEILKLCDGNHSIAAIIAMLQNQFTQDAINDLTEDTYHFLTEALQKGWLTVV